MSKDQTTQPTLFQEDSPVNHSALQENGEEKMMTATSGMKLLELLPKQNQNGLLEKMLKALLTSPMVQSCNRYNKTWKKRVSKSNVLLFQLQVSVLGIKEKESGLSDAMFQTPTTQDARIGPNNIGGNKHRMKRGSIALADQILFQTPTATEIPMRSKEAMEKRKKYRESIGRKSIPHGNLLEQIQMMYPTPVVNDNSLETIEKWKQRQKIKKEQGINLHFKLCHHVQMYPTPTAMDHIDRKGMRPSRAATNRKSGYLSEMIKMYPTPTTRDYKDSTISNSHQNRNSDSLPIKIMKMYGTPKAQDSRAALTDRGKGNFGEQVHQEYNAKQVGGRLNPNFVEFLMAYPQDWTKIEPTE